MTVESATFLGQQALMTALLVGAPLLLATLLVGTVVSLVQTVTQVQEVTLVFVPKILAAFLVIAVAGGWMLDVAVGFGTEMFLSISDEP